jgi:hypothetical protein
VSSHLETDTGSPPNYQYRSVHRALLPVPSAGPVRRGGYTLMTVRVQ